MKQLLKVSCTLCALISHHALADNVVLIGGGFDLGSSPQVLEDKMRWTQETLKTNNVSPLIYFTDGNDPAADISATASDEADVRLSPISRVYGEYQADRLRYVSHTLDGVVGSTEANTLKNNLQQFLETSTEPTLMIYQGYGSPASELTGEAKLKLWGNTSLTASELRELANQSRQPFRYLFSHRQSGGLNSMAFANPENGTELSEQLICGFTAEKLDSSHHLRLNAELIGNQDYASVIFAAITGYYRDGEILSRESDTNGNGETDLREAHLYALEQAFSNELAQASSEQFLERWQPWFLKWLPAVSSLPNNEYAKLFRSLAAKYDVLLTGNTAKAIRHALDAAQTKQSSALDVYQALQQQERNFQDNIQAGIHKQWPEFATPYTQAYRDLVSSNQSEAVSQWIESQSDYPKLVDIQLQLIDAKNEWFDAERFSTQLRKMLHMRRLASIKEQLYQYGSKHDIDSYEQLLMCESQPIGNLTASNFASTHQAD